LSFSHASINTVLIFVNQSEIWHDVVIRGDLADVVIGADTTIGAASVIRPPFNGTKEAPGYLSVSIGSHSAVGAGVVCEAAEIGSNVVVGDGAVLVSPLVRQYPANKDSN